MATRDKHIVSHFVGFFEGEGSISCLMGKQKQGRYVSASVFIGVTNTNREKLEFFATHIGGHIRQMKTMPKRKPAYRLEWWGNKAVEIIHLLLEDPCFQIKRRVAELAVAFKNSQKKSIGRRAYNDEEISRLLRIKQEVNFLNMRGVLAVAETKPSTPGSLGEAIVHTAAKAA